MLRSVGTLKTNLSPSAFVTTKRPASPGGSSEASGFSTTPNGAYIPPPTLMPLWQAAQPLSMKTFSPLFCLTVSASLWPRRNLSNAAFGVFSVASNNAIAFCALAKVTGADSPGNAALNAKT